MLALTAGPEASLLPCRQPAKDATERAPQRRRGQVVDEEVQAGVEGTNEDGHIAPLGLTPVTYCSPRGGICLRAQNTQQRPA